MTGNAYDNWMFAVCVLVYVQTSNQQSWRSKFNVLFTGSNSKAKKLHVVSFVRSWYFLMKTMQTKNTISCLIRTITVYDLAWKALNSLINEWSNEYNLFFVQSQHCCYRSILQQCKTIIIYRLVCLGGYVRSGIGLGAAAEHIGAIFFKLPLECGNGVRREDNNSPAGPHKYHPRGHAMLDPLNRDCANLKECPTTSQFLKDARI